VPHGIKHEFIQPVLRAPSFSLARSDAAILLLCERRQRPPDKEQTNISLAARAAVAQCAGESLGYVQ
jgi:hypothetical protein